MQFGRGTNIEHFKRTSPILQTSQQTCSWRCSPAAASILTGAVATKTRPTTPSSLPASLTPFTIFAALIGEQPCLAPDPAIGYPAGQALAASTLADSGNNLLYRSEEHTSELQSLMRISYAVFCLKKKKTK